MDRNFKQKMIGAVAIIALCLGTLTSFVIVVTALFYGVRVLF